MRASDWLSVGQLAKRTGVSVSAIHFYEARALISPDRNASGHRRFQRSDIRRLSFIVVTQKLGFTIRQIGDLLRTLPEHRTPSKADWTKISRAIRSELDLRIAALEQLRNNLDGCIGCGCLSLKRCKLYNPDDRAGALGTGPRYLMGDSAASLGSSDQS